MGWKKSLRCWSIKIDFQIAKKHDEDSFHYSIDWGAEIIQTHNLSTVSGLKQGEDSPVCVVYRKEDKHAVVSISGLQNDTLNSLSSQVLDITSKTMSIRGEFKCHSAVRRNDYFGWTQTKSNTEKTISKDGYTHCAQGWRKASRAKLLLSNFKKPNPVFSWEWFKLSTS